MTLQIVENQVKGCSACPLYKGTTQAVHGHGNPNAALMIVGEAPGNQEDKIGRPFIGPAGKMLDHALVANDITRSDIYISNIVKHFPHIIGETGRRKAIKPGDAEVATCSSWLLKEIDLVRPGLILCLGASSAQFFLGKAFKVMTHRGDIRRSALTSVPVTGTVHPSALLRRGRRPDEIAEFCADIGRAYAYALEKKQ